MVTIKLSLLPKAPIASAENAFIGEEPDKRMAMLEITNAVKIASKGIPIVVRIEVNLNFLPAILNRVL